MARVSFYVLQQHGADARYRFACRLAEKAYRHEHRVHILAGDERTIALLDDLLWTFRDGSFVPHERVSGSSAGAESPVTIGTTAEPGDAPDLLINLCDDVPSSAGSFPRIAELVTSDEDTRAGGRRRFAAYRSQGHDIETHNL